MKNENYDFVVVVTVPVWPFSYYLLNEKSFSFR